VYMNHEELDESEDESANTFLNSDFISFLSSG
jgi:hypothetical protein